MVNEYAQSSTWVMFSAHIDLHRRCQSSAVGIQDTCAGGEKNERPQICRSARQFRHGRLGVGEYDTIRSDVQVYGVCFQATSPLAARQHTLANDARSSRRGPTERASSHWARRAPSIACRPLPANARFRATTPPLFPRRAAAPCVAASLTHTGTPQGRGKDRLAARLVVPFVGRGGMR